MELTYTMHQSQLQTDLPRLIDRLKEDSDGDTTINKDYIEDDGEGNETFIIDVPFIEESYFYANSWERDEDYDQLTQLIDLVEQNM